MRVYFSKYPKGFRPFCYEPIFGRFKENVIYDITQQLRKMFKSLQVEKILASELEKSFYVYYNFTDPSEEAYFIMLSDAGIEI